MSQRGRAQRHCRPCAKPPAKTGAESRRGKRACTIQKTAPGVRAHHRQTVRGQCGRPFEQRPHGGACKYEREAEALEARVAALEQQTDAPGTSDRASREKLDEMLRQITEIKELTPGCCFASSTTLKLARVIMSRESTAGSSTRRSKSFTGFRRKRQSKHTRSETYADRISSIVCR